MLINHQHGRSGLVAVFVLMAVTLYMAFAFPYTLLHFKQHSETTEIKAVILVGRHGEVTPTREAYFESYGEQPPDQWFQLGGPGQLTSMGKERMYLLGKFLRLRYHQRLLAGGNPRRLEVRSENSDKCLESAQALLAGLNPPRDKPWLWSSSGQDEQFAREWQPKAVHTTFEHQDDLLSSQTRCLQMDSMRAAWKNSSRYTHLLNEFRHDLQVLRQNTGLEFEDDLEVAVRLEEQLGARRAFTDQQQQAGDPLAPMPGWYTSTFAQRLGHIADVTAGCRFDQAPSQRLFVGRLLDTMVRHLFAKIRSDLTSGESLLTGQPAAGDQDESESSPHAADGSKGQTIGPSKSNGPALTSDPEGGNGGDAQRRQQRERTLELVRSKTKALLPEDQVRLRLAHQMEPNMFVYITDKQHLTALLNSLKIYSQQPHYGALLLLELHHDPVNQIHFLRMFTVSSATHNVLPEPVRVNPIACLDSVECSPQQFERNTRHLTLDKQTWHQSCLVDGSGGLPADEFTSDQEESQQGAATTSAADDRPLPTTTVAPARPGQTDRSDRTSTSVAPSADDGERPASIEQLESGPIQGASRPISSGKTTSEAERANGKEQAQQLATTIAPTLTEIKTEAPPSERPAELATLSTGPTRDDAEATNSQQVTSLAGLLDAQARERNGAATGDSEEIPPAPFHTTDTKASHESTGEGREAAKVDNQAPDVSNTRADDS